MKSWKKKISSVGLSASLLAGIILAPAAANAEPSGKNKVGISSINVNQPFLQQQQPNPQEKSPLSEELLTIRYSTPLTAAEHKRLGTTLVKQISELKYAVVKVQNKKDLHKIISNYRKLGNVITVNPTVMYQTLGYKDPKVQEQYHLSLLQIDKAQKLAGKNKVKVAVVDQGIDMNHPELRGQLLPSFNTVNPINGGSPDFHGTHVAGILAGKKDNGIGGYGINPNASIIPIDVFDRGWGATDFAIAQGILQAIKSGAQVINLSLGGPMPSPVIEDAIKKALEKNIVVVAAAGNNGNDWVNYPSGYEGVISVGSINKYKNLAPTSSFGTSVDVVAPGEDVYSTIYEYERKSSFRPLSGTSMAAPVVAGVASLLLSKNPKLTPGQVEYILEHTATDLGTKGFDVKFANGLVNPVKAMQFDIKKIPAIAKKSLTEKEILAKAEVLKTAGSTLKEGAFTKPFEEKWYKMSVKKGEFIQASLEGSYQYDYKMMIHFYSPDGKLLLDVNKVKDGKTEGKLIEAPFTGTVAIGVKDANGSYDDSGKKASQYSLMVEKLSSLPEDESSVENPINIEEIPFETKELPMTYTGEEGDDDYLTFSVKERQVMKIQTSGVPGVNSSISVYMAEMLMPSEPSPEAGAEFKASHEEGEEGPEPMFYANSKGISEGETLTFVAEPDTKYAIKTSNKQSNYYGMYEFYMDFDQLAGTKAVESSAIPYSVMINGKTFPADEDNFPFMEGAPGEEGSGVTEEYAGKQLENQRNAIKAAHEEPWVDETIPLIQENALAYQIGEVASGYLQMFDDQDWFKVTPRETGIYEFNLRNKIELPMMEIYQISKYKDPEGQEFTYLNQIGSNINYDWSSPGMKPKLYTGLKKGETYYVKMNIDFFTNQISFDPYTFSSKLIVKNPQDKYENNDAVEKVKNIPGTIFKGNFAMPMDQDVFYLQSKADQVYGVKIERGELTSQLRKYPKEIVSPFYGFMTITEDLNKNRKLDDNEYDYVQFIGRVSFNGNTHGSFKAEKGKNYIVVTSGYAESFVPLTLWPYKITVAPVNKNDEDKGNVVKNNIPSKPIKMKKVKSNNWEMTGHLNSGVAYGDNDWYSFTLDKDATGVIKLEVPVEMDGKIALYQNGKQITSADFYPEGDAEVLSVKLKKGTYQVKVSDYFGNSTLTPYKLKVLFN